MRQPCDASLISIRPARPDEARVIFDIHYASVHTLCAHAYSHEHIAHWFDGRGPEIHGHLLSAGRLWLAVVDDEVVGFVAAEPGEVTLLFVKPGGTTRGVGTALFQHGLVEAARGASGPVIVVSTMNAVPFYERFGFVAVEQLCFLRGLSPSQQWHYPVVKMQRAVSS